MSKLKKSAVEQLELFSLRLYERRKFPEKLNSIPRRESCVLYLKQDLRIVDIQRKNFEEGCLAIQNQEGEVVSLADEFDYQSSRTNKFEVDC